MLYMRRWIMSILVQMMGSRLNGTKLLLDLKEYVSMTICLKFGLWTQIQSNSKDKLAFDDHILHAELCFISYLVGEFSAHIWENFIVMKALVWSAGIFIRIKTRVVVYTPWIYGFLPHFMILCLSGQVISGRVMHSSVSKQNKLIIIIIMGIYNSQTYPAKGCSRRRVSQCISRLKSSQISLCKWDTIKMGL